MDSPYVIQSWRKGEYHRLCKAIGPREAAKIWKSFKEVEAKAEKNLAYVKDHIRQLRQTAFEDPERTITKLKEVAYLMPEDLGVYQFLITRIIDALEQWRKDETTLSDLRD